MHLPSLSLLLWSLVSVVSAIPNKSPPGYTITRTHTKTKTWKPTTCPAVKTTITKTEVSTVTVGHKASTVTVTDKVSTCKTKTTSLPVPTQACLVTSPTCKATGWDVSYYANPFAGYGYPPSGLGPGYYISEHLKPKNSSTTDITYFPQNTPPSGDPIVYPGTSFDNGQAPYYVGWTIDVAGMTIDNNNFTLVYSGLYKAPSTGNFTLCGDADNIVATFFGAKSGAFPCGGKPKANAMPAINGTVATGGNYNNPTSCFTEEFTEGFYYPIRLVMANFQGPSAFGFTIAPPGGTATYNLTGLIYPPSCAV